MSSLDSDHNYYSLEPRKPSQQSSYNPTKRSKVSTILGQNNASVGTNGITGNTTRGDSPDPHDFYRRHQDQYRTMLGEGSGQGEIKVQQNGNTTIRAAVPKLSLSSRVSSRYNTSPTERSPLSAARSSPTLSNTARNRQTSLKELVNKFNQNPDEALPLPRKSNSRSPSASPRTIKARNSSLSNRPGIPSTYKPSTSPISKKTSRPSRPDPPNSIRPYASQSTTNLADGHPGRPLFGEILALSPIRGDAGYGTPTNRRRRRGSEGSMHSPNPMFPCEHDGQGAGITPSSPSAWYLGVTPTLEEIKNEGNIPDLPSNMHRRTRSDFSGAPSRPPASRMFGTNLSPHRDREPPSSPSSTNTSKRNSQSRIPISTRRLSTTSDSGNSAQSTRANSALGRAPVKSPTRTVASRPNHSQYPRSPPRHSRSSTPQKSPRRNDFGTGIQRPATSPRLPAYISAPMPKKSPPLRSSRPRPPVSNASTTASRARAVERFPGPDSGIPRNKRDSRPRKPPELAGVDFAARRERIQQAVTQTVREDEQRRASMALDRIGPGMQSLGDESLDTGHVHLSEDQAQLHDEENAEFVKARPETAAADVPKSERELTINTGHLSERSVLDLSLEDSPTLGTYSRFSNTMKHVPERDTSHSSDVEPSSAITAGTSDSVDTFFDDEPQDDSQDSSRPISHDHEALLNHIMNMRDTSPVPEDPQSNEPVDETTTSDKDDEESIHIMLGDTPVLEKAPFKDPYDDGTREPQSREGPESRWSMSSWTSSAPSRNDRDVPMERIDEHAPQSSEPAHLSISTSASQQTPQPWSPASFDSDRTARTTMDSDAYSTINRVLDQYHDPSLVSPKTIQDAQQHIFTQSPDLARQGGWDPKKVTQLYLQEMARKRSKPLGAIPDSGGPGSLSTTRSDSFDVSKAPEKEIRDDLDEKMVENRERQYDDRTPPAESLEVDEFRPARASLNHPDDWNMSPSMGGLEMQAQALDSPATDEKPSLPPKDWRSFKKDLANTPDRPTLPEISGLGLKINVLPPERTDSPITPPPLLPVYSPPDPPAVESLPSLETRSPPSPSIHSKHVPSTAFPHRNSISDELVPPLPESEPSRPPGYTPSARPSDASSQSQNRPSVDGTSMSTDPTSKASSPSPDQKRLTRRGHIIKELVDTEHSFGQDMKVVDDIYKGTANVIIISAEDVKTLFGNSDQIVAFSTNFLDALKQASRSVYVLSKNKRWRSNRVSNATTHSGTTDDQASINGVELSDEEKDRRTSIGEAFGNNMENMEKVYSDYLKNHDAANQKLQALQKNRNIEIWLRECRQYAHDLTSAWDLDSLLVKPVQRILKYPLLLDQLLEATPENHPDFTALDVAARELKGISMRINEMKRRADIMEQVTKTGRKRKESDVRIGLSKAFGRRTEKLRQQVGLSDVIEDKAYSAVSEEFGSRFFQLQVVMRDVEMYTNDVQIYMNRFCDFALAIEAHIDVGGTSYPESESRWRKFRMSTREISMTALTDHIAAVRKNVIEPMTTLIKLHESPQKLMQKRNKRVMDYARFKATKDRGEKPDRKTMEQGEQYLAVNETLKDELPKLFALTGKLVEACLNNFVQLQLQWLAIWRRKLSQAIEDNRVPANAEEIKSAFSQEFKFVNESVMTLGICNGSMLAGVVNQLNFPSASTTLNGDDGSSSRQGSSLDLSRRRTLSVSSEQSPVLPRPDFGARGSSGSFFGDAPQLAHGGISIGHYVEPSRRMRASSTLSGHSPRTPEVPGSYHSFSNSTTPVNATPGRPSTATPRTYTDPIPSPSRPSLDTPTTTRPSEESARIGRISGQTYPAPSSGRASPPPHRYSGYFSSALPMSDSPRAQSPPHRVGSSSFNVMFLAASVYEFNIDKARREGGYSYLTYVAGEIFDVLGEKGELWLAKNQDDNDNEVGWIWNKHFVKLAS